MRVLKEMRTWEERLVSQYSQMLECSARAGRGAADGMDVGVVGGQSHGLAAKEAQPRSQHYKATLPRMTHCLDEPPQRSPRVWKLWVLLSRRLRSPL